MPTPALRIDRLHKRFGQVVALDGIDLMLHRGQVLALLGPSGCGKTTLLRCIAGLSEANEGEIHLDGECVAAPGRHLSPDDRRLGMVFQDYALWPHMSVYQNVAFPLEMQGVKANARRPQVEWALALVGLADFAERTPGALSGGQQQRVALARAIVAKPRLLLMDEPLSNLDKGLRESLALEIRSLIEELGLTAVFVTHDQHEAFALADRVAVLQQGRLQQVDSPERLFHTPATPAIADFVDAGTLLDARLDAHGLAIADTRLPLAAACGHQGEIRLLLPRRALHLCAPDDGLLRARITGRLFQGEHLSLQLTLADGRTLKLHAPHAPERGCLVGVGIDVSALRAWDANASLLDLIPRTGVATPVPAKPDLRHSIDDSGE
ncbi:ABC transporter ATP-binding protein [Halomonas sp. MCCC 1A11062]|uniref:ABC transporter ATP-binding protein n=1 Tax=Halomonas sp. MCCC 1A11062 TaxID=2733485 RepID=UPI001F3E20F8|nr:ABC transporter ATP-binding protein [Halomonas sp. MCCC 1A11062]MCE8040268.1 ABC transporter ATP-binding protein [Halomonas sp. MCCC 1A11062]